MEIPILDAPLYDIFFVQVSFAVPHSTIHFFDFFFSFRRAGGYYSREIMISMLNYETLILTDTKKEGVILPPGFLVFYYLVYKYFL
jgi:hypothetical protein